jgi:hypothetical protein
MKPEFEAILSSDQPELEKLTRAYQFILQEHITHAHGEIELQKALGDEQALIQEKIKLGMLEYVNGIFAFCYLRVTGRKLDHE